MKKLITISLFVLIVSFAFSQGSDRFDFDKFKAKKIAYITDAINLTPAEAEKFWPVYNEYEQKRFSQMGERHMLENKFKEKNENLSDDKYIELLKKMAAIPKAEGELSMEYNEKFLKILPPKKVVKLYMADMEFKSFLLREFKRGEPDRSWESEKR